VLIDKEIDKLWLNEFFFFFFSFFNTCAGKKVDEEEGIFGR
jgi:hypothetical protein